jgi:orotate phosphoribosyltransferase
MTEAELIALFRRSHALLDGHFQLSSGRHSDRYFQCALVLQDPVVATQLGAALAEKFHALLPIDVVAAPALGGVLVAHEVARSLGSRALFTERINGIMTLRRGFTLQPGSRVIVVEDVITTGLSTGETMGALESIGGQVVAVGALIDRSGGDISKTMTVPVHALVSLPFLSFDPGECPLCANKIPVVKPGSRI